MFASRLTKSSVLPARTSAVTAFLLLLCYTGSLDCSAAPVQQLHTCAAPADVAKLLSLHADCLDIIDGPTCTEDSIQDAGCRDSHHADYAVCGSVLVSERLDEVDSDGVATLGFPTYSHCSYTARPAGQPCQPGTSQGQQAAGAPASRGKGGVSSSEGQDGGASRGAHQCGGGVMRGLCLPANSYSREHERCQEFTCEHGLCHPPVPVNEGEPCGPPSPAPVSGGVPASASPASPFTPCVQRVCRAGRCVSEPLPDGASCGPAGPCREHHCRAGVCVPMVEEDGVMCGPSTACATHVCIEGECVQERKPDGRLCWYSQAAGDCPHTCLQGRCTPCACDHAYAFWAGSQNVPGFQWTPFPTDLQRNSFGGYFNLLAEELDIPPVTLPYDAASSASRYAAESAIVVCTGCRRGMRLQPGTNMVQDGAVIHGTVGLTVSPVRDGTYVTLDVVMAPNVSHRHYLLSWHPWASVSPPPLNTPHRWGNLSGSRTGSSSLDSARGTAFLPTQHHSAWAFVEKRPVRWAFTQQEQIRSVFVALFLRIASCSKLPPREAPSSRGPGQGQGLGPVLGGSGASSGTAGGAASAANTAPKPSYAGGTGAAAGAGSGGVQSGSGVPKGTTIEAPVFGASSASGSRGSGGAATDSNRAAAVGSGGSIEVGTTGQVRGGGQGQGTEYVARSQGTGQAAGTGSGPGAVGSTSQPGRQ